jgi:hypothetical protein
MCTHAQSSLLLLRPLILIRAVLTSHSENNIIPLTSKFLGKMTLRSTPQPIPYASVTIWFVKEIFLEKGGNHVTISCLSRNPPIFYLESHEWRHIVGGWGGPMWPSYWWWPKNFQTLVSTFNARLKSFANFRGSSCSASATERQNWQNVVALEYIGTGLHWCDRNAHAVAVVVPCVDWRLRPTFSVWIRFWWKMLCKY